MFRARSLVAGIAVIAAIVAGVFLGRAAPAGGRSPLAVAVAALPADTSIVGFTDWASITDRYSVSTATDRDLSTRSALASGDLGQMRSALGWRLQDLGWEAYGKAPTGDFAVVGLTGGVPSGDRLRKAGYRQVGDVWSATGEINTDTPLYRFLVLIPHGRLVLMSDGFAAVKRLADAAAGRTASLAENRDIADTVRSLAGVDTALIQSGPLGCDATNAIIDADTLRQVRAAQERLGRLAKYRVLGRGLVDDGSKLQRFIVSMNFGSASIAARQASVRAAMSTGPFIGRAGAMSEVLRLRDTRSNGDTAVLTYAHPVDSDYLMPGRGPLLPASC